MPRRKPNDAAAEAVTLRPLAQRVLDVVVVGDSRLVTHRFSEKAKHMMLDKQTRKAASIGKKAPRNPNEEYQGAMYLTADGLPGVPAVAFKAAMVAACRLHEGLPMTVARIAIHVLGDVLPVFGDAPQMREDIVRLDSGVADLRYRPSFERWWCRLRIKFVCSVVTAEQVINLLQTAGLCGVCEWRPASKKSYTGTWGMFHVATPEDLAAIESHIGATRP